MKVDKNTPSLWCWIVYGKKHMINQSKLLLSWNLITVILENEYFMWLDLIFYSSKRFTYFLCMLAYVYVYASQTCLHTWMSEEGVKFPKSEVTSYCELSCGCWEPNLDPPEEKQVLLTTESTLTPWVAFLWDGHTLLGLLGLRTPVWLCTETADLQAYGDFNPRITTFF